jgi:polygalacturonase
MVTRHHAGRVAALALLAAVDCGRSGTGPAPGPGSDASLASLVPSAGALSPLFGASTTSYRLTVPASTATVTLVPRATDPRVASIAVAQDGGTSFAVASGAASRALDVPGAGATSSVVVKVIAEDGATQRAYAVALAREAAGVDGLCGVAPAATPIQDAGLPAEPTDPAPCAGATLSAAYGVDGATGLPLFTAGTDPADTTRIQAAVDACAASLTAGAQGSVRLVRGAATGSQVAFVAGPLALKAGVTLWVDEGVTLFASRQPRDYDVVAGAASCGVLGPSSSGCKPFIQVKGTSSALLAGAGIAGRGVIDGLGGEPLVTASGVATNQTWWDVAQAAEAQGTSFSNPRLVDVTRARGFTLHQITLRNSPKFHVGLESDGFMVWGVTIQTPSRPVNSQGTALSPAYARNTDGIDPYDANDGYVVYSSISTGDDQIALKCGKYHLNDASSAGQPSCRNITIAHDHFGTGHGMSIGSETNAGASDGTGIGLDGLHVYDLSIDGLLPSGGAGAVNLNGLRIKSDRSRGGIVKNVTYEDVCMRGLANPVLLEPAYDAGATGNAVPTFLGITLRNVRHVSCAGAPTPVVTLDGFDASHASVVTLDGVVVDGLTAGNVRAQDAAVALGPGPVNFAPSGVGVSVTDGRVGGGTANACAGKFVALP